MLLTLLLLLLLALPVQADVLCDQIDDFVTHTPASDIVTNASISTLAVWAYATGTPIAAPNYWNLEGIFGNDLADWGMWRGNLSSAGDRWMNAGATITTPVTVNTWTHLALVHTGNTAFLYTNGLLVSSAGDGDWPNLTSPMRLCNAWVDSSTRALGGRLGSFVATTSALTAQQIEIVGKSGLYNPGLVGVTYTARIPLDDCGDGVNGNGFVFADRSGNGRTFTGNRGTNGTGLTCVASTKLSYAVGVQ